MRRSFPTKKAAGLIRDLDLVNAQIQELGEKPVSVSVSPINVKLKKKASLFG